MPLSKKSAPSSPSLTVGSDLSSSASPITEPNLSSSASPITEPNLSSSASPTVECFSDLPSPAQKKIKIQCFLFIVSFQKMFCSEKENFDLERKLKKLFRYERQ